MTILGTVFRPQLPPELLQAIARTADETGLSELWLWEDCFREGGVATAAAALAWTERVRIGVGLLPVPLRNVALTAMEIGTLHRIFPGRLLVGVGHGVQSWMAQVGARVESPLTLLGEYVSALAALLRGEEVTTDGRYVQLDRVALDWPPESPAELSVGAVGPRTLRLSGEMADGTILTASTTPDDVRRARRLIEEGRAAGDRPAHHRITVYLLAATGPGSAQRLEAEARSSGDDPARFGVAGTADEVADAVRRWAAAGADAVILQPTADEPDPEGFVEFAARDVRPLLG